MEGYSAPVPWVAVDMMPATLWSEMDPRLLIAKSWSSRRSCSLCNFIPAWTVIVIFSSSTLINLFNLSVLTMNPSVQAKSEGECPVPIALTFFPEILAR